MAKLLNAQIIPDMPIICLLYVGRYCYPLNDYRQTSLSEACAVITPRSQGCNTGRNR